VTNLDDISDKAQRAGREADQSKWFDHAIRFGLVAYGVVNLLIAWVALQLAFGDHSENASSQGALKELASQPFGDVLIWLVAIGMFVLVLWRVLEAIYGHRDEDGGKRVFKALVSLGKAVIYGAVGVTALQIAMGSGTGSGGKSGSDSMTQKLMDLPAGPWIVGLIGLVIIGYGVSQIVIAWTDKFAEHLTAEGKSGDTGTAYIWFGKIGYCAKGIAAGLVGVLFLYAAVTHDPKKSGGLDAALGELLQQPFGPYLLAAVAAGIACYGLFCFARARHLSR
jgi:hypothetical protein